MAKSKAKTLPEFDSTAELVDFFETHDLGDYLDQMPEADFEVKIERGKHSLEERAKRARLERFEQLLTKVPDVEPAEGDEL